MDRRYWKYLITVGVVVALCVVAVPAASASTVNVSISAPNFFLGTPVTYTVSGEAEVGQTFQINVLSGSSATECYNQGPSSIPVLKPVQVGRPHESSVEPFSQSATIPVTDYSALGTYTVCAMIRKGASVAESPTTFTVVPAPIELPKSEKAKSIEAPASTPPASNPVPSVPGPIGPASLAGSSVAPLAPSLAAPSVAASASVRKLHAALAKCKRQKNKHKRVKCERAAKTAAHHR